MCWFVTASLVPDYLVVVWLSLYNVCQYGCHQDVPHMLCVCQSWCLSELYLKRLISLSFYRSCQFIPQLAICHSLLGIYFMLFLHGAHSCYNNYHKTLLENIVAEHCYNYKTLLQLQNIVTTTKHCYNYKTLLQLQNIVTTTKHCYNYKTL